MAINYASKFATQIDERFSREAMSTPAVNNDYDFVGVKTVNVYSVQTLYGFRVKATKITSRITRVKFIMKLIGNLHCNMYKIS